MNYTRRKVLLNTAAFTAPLLVASRATAQAAFPVKPVRLIVPDPAGALPSNFARLVAEGLAKRLGQPVVVDNRAGAGGSIGTRALLNEPADGHTLLWTHTSNQVVSALVRQPMPYDPINDFAPIALSIVNTGGFLVVNPKLPIRTPRELFAYAKANPGKLTYASAGVGSITHLAIDLIKARTGTFILHVPFNGPNPAMLAVASGDADFAVAGGLAAALPLVQAGKLRLLARLGERRSPDFPDVPTLAEDTVPGLVIPFWMGMTARAGTPPDIIARLNQEVNAVVASDPAIKKQTAISYLESVIAPPSALRDVVARDVNTFAKIVRDNKITTST
jgi:tripartite-type tricarboxylate transporter receptor subunit TctC